MALIGYARVSTDGQDLEPQLRALREAGCATLVEERASGADRGRPELARLLGRLRGRLGQLTPADLTAVERAIRVQLGL